LVDFVEDEPALVEDRVEVCIEVIAAELAVEPAAVVLERAEAREAELQY